MPNDPMKTGEWVKLENYPTLIAAEVAKSTLELSGIEAEIFDGEIANLYSTALGGVNLMVKPEDLESSREILQTEHDVEDYVVPEAEIITSTSVYCSKCHSKDVETRKVVRKPDPIFIVNWFGKYFGAKKTMRCLRCGNTWSS